MGALMAYMLGNILGRTAGPIAMDLYERYTVHGKQMVERGYDKKEREFKIEREHRSIIREDEYQEYLRKQEIDYTQKIKFAKEQAILSKENWALPTFYEKCFPLKNPYELQMGSSVIRTNTLEDKRQFVPLRVITALTSMDVRNASTSPSASVNTQISEFLHLYYPVNGIRGIRSDIGSWKDGFTNDDATLHYLFEGLKGQPIVVLAPRPCAEGEYIYSLYTAHLGEDLQYPNCIQFGRMNISLYKKYLAVEEIRKFEERQARLNKEIDNSSSEGKSLNEAIKIIHEIDNLKQTVGISEDDEIYLIKKIIVPTIIKNEVDAILDKATSELYSAFIAMYSDAYYLNAYGIMPQLPFILRDMKYLPKQFIPEIIRYYSALLEAAMQSKAITTKDSLHLIYNLIEAEQQLTGKTRQNLMGNADSLLGELTSLYSKEELNEISQIRKRIRHTINNQITQ